MLPTSLQIIADYAFSYCSNLREVRIPESITYIGNGAFNSENIRDIYTWTIEPTNIGQTTFSSGIFTKATLHVPETARKLYFWDTQWSQFTNITQFNAPYTYFYLANKDLEIDEETPRLDGNGTDNPNADLKGNSGLIVEGDEGQNLGEVNLETDGNGTAPSIVGGDSKTETSGANVNIDNLHIKITIKKGKWYFFAFPFDIEYANIHFDGQFVWRYYDGQYRAEKGSGAWKNQTGKLERGKGYIFQGSKDGTLTLTVPNASVNGKDKVIALESHTSAAPENASWNLVGNPFTSYYELKDLGYNAPITVWNGNTYVAYSPEDDDLTIHPFQAFFVQKPSAEDDLTFAANKRETKNQSEDPIFRQNAAAHRPARTRSSVTRHLINLEVSDGENTDKTRVVFNEQRTEGYDIECDAAKFLSENVPQIYSLDSKNTQYAINERPEGDGTVRLGFMANVDGTFTIKATRMDEAVMLKDLLTGETFDLGEGEYQFEAKAGTTENRFILTTTRGATYIEEKTADDGNATYYDMNGIQTGNAQKGIVIEKAGNKVKKVAK